MSAPMSAVDAIRALRPPRIDGAVAGIVLVLVALAVFAPSELLPSLSFLLDALIYVAPFLLVSVALAAGAKASGADALIARAFVGREVQMIVLAAAFGGLSPFCSCGVIPVIAALLAMGVPLAPVMAFWLASPIMDPTMFVLTVGTLGLDFAIAKTIAAIGLGLLGGFATYALTRSGALTDPLREGIGDGGCGASSVVRDAKPVVWTFWREEARRATFARSSLSTTIFLGKWLALAFLLEAVMLAFVPAEFVRELVGDGGFLTVFLASIVGVPAYLNGYAALPLVAGFVEQGMAPGAALAFLIAGGVTSIPAAVAVWALAKKPVFALYVVLALAGSMASGLLFQLAMG